MTIDLKKQKKRLTTTINNAGPRYTSALNVKVSIATMFDGFGRTFAFYDDLKTRTGKFVSDFQRSEAKKARLLVGEECFLALEKECKNLVDIIRKIPDNGGKFRLPLELIAKQAKSVKNNIDQAFTIIRQKREEEQKKNPVENENGNSYDSEIFGEERNYLNKLANSVNELAYFSRGRVASASNHQFIVLRGEAGSGKTHFLCDLTKNRLGAKLPTFIFLGQEFNDKDPWKIILSKIGWTASKKEFLDALEKNASSKKTRAFIIIDAINEQQKKVVWSLLTSDLKKYKSICFILSVRTGFEFDVLPQSLRGKVLDVIHEGFADSEWDALTSFFQFYNLEPDLPLLFPDFTNPLFLKIFCETYQENGNTVQLRGHQGFTRVFERYVVKQGKKTLTDMGSTNPDARTLIWKDTIKKIADYMVTNKVDFIPEIEAESIAEKVFTGKGKQFLTTLEKNSLLLKNLIYADKAPYKVTGFSYSFPYQKFSDHLIVRHLLADSASIKDPKTLFTPTGKLHYIMQDQYKFRGLIYALAVQIPERFQAKELILLVDKKFKYSQLAKDTFLYSLIWRDAEIKRNKLRFFNQKRVFSIINKVIRKHPDSFDEIMETILTVSAVPKHPLNAYLLSAHLEKKFNMAKRDSVWIPFLYYKHNNSSAVDRLVHWALKISHKTSYDDESVKLVAIALSWFLSTSDRYLRDVATKALVNLLKNRISILIEVLEHFKKCDDLYILERLLAVSYGCSMLTQDSKLCDLGLYIYKKIFSQSKPPVHILIRDYARGTIEKALYKYPNLTSKIDQKKILPPYGSKWPDKFPVLAPLQKKYKDVPYGETQRSGYSTIWHSIMYGNGGGIADFGNYILNSAIGNWSNRKLLKNGKAPKSNAQIAEKFIEALNSVQKDLWDKYQKARQNNFRFVFPISLGDIEKKVVSKVDNEENIAQEKKDLSEAKKAFEKSLSPKEQSVYKKASHHFDRSRSYKMDDLDSPAIQRWVFQKVIQLGWKPKLFYNFDSNNNERARSPHKAERIGKKYQWIAFYEILARIADNFAFKRWRDSYTTFQGPWSLSIRNIDPSHSLTLIEEEAKENTWWLSKKYNKWQKSIPHNKWVNNDDILKFTDTFLSVKDGENREWLSLNSYFKWREPKRPGREDHFSDEKREVWFMIRAYIIKKKDSAKMFAWVKSKKNTWGWLPEPFSLHHVNLGEIPNSSAYLDEYWNGQLRWEKLKDNERKETDLSVLSTCEMYINERSGFDCSVNDTVSVKLLSKEIIDGLELIPNGNPGEFVDKKGILIAQDPSIKNGGENCLLVEKKSFLEFLKKNEYLIMWVSLGEKLALGSSDRKKILEVGANYLMDKNGEIKIKRHKEFR